MTIPLSDNDAAILLGATLMHWGVPFRRTAKHELTDQQQAIIDEVSEKLIALRNVFQRPHLRDVQEVTFSDQEITLLIGVVDDCLVECGDDPIELRLQLKTSERSEVETLVDRMRVSSAA